MYLIARSLVAGLLGFCLTSACCSGDCGPTKKYDPPRPPQGFGTGIGAFSNVVGITDRWGNGVLLERGAADWSELFGYSINQSYQPIGVGIGDGIAVFSTDGLAVAQRSDAGTWRPVPRESLPLIPGPAGSSVAPSGNRFALLTNNNGGYSSVELFERDGSSVIKTQRLLHPVSMTVLFSSVAIAEDVLVVSDRDGVVRWYTRADVGFDADPVYTTDVSHEPNVCVTCDINEAGDTAIIATAACAASTQPGTGEIWVFEKGAGGWGSQSATILTRTLPVSGYVRLTISATTVAAISDANGGSIQIYERTADGWPASPTQEIRTTSGTPLIDIDMSEATLIAGAPDANQGVGEVYVFEKGPTGFPERESVVLRPPATP